MFDNKKLHNLYLGLGTNLGDREQNIQLALNKIGERIGKVIACSAFYITKPVGFESENQFLNAACQVQTSLEPLDVLTETQNIEKDMGRVAKSVDKVYSDRIIDIDLLLFDNSIIEYPHLVLPHPHLHEREFVLLPLLDIAGEIVHPVLGKTMNELAKKIKQ